MVRRRFSYDKRISALLVIEMDGVRRLRRIEDMRYNELQKSGHLKLRKPWAIHRQQLNEQICGIIPTPNDQSSDFSFGSSTYKKSSAS